MAVFDGLMTTDIRSDFDGFLNDLKTLKIFVNKQIDV